MPRLASRATIKNLLQLTHSVNCPCHGCASLRSPGSTASMVRAGLNMVASHGRTARTYAAPVEQSVQREYAFEMAASNCRFGPGVTREVGLDLQAMKPRKVGVWTDKNLLHLTAMKQTIESLEAANVPYEVYDRVRVEPNDASWADTIDFARKNDFSHFLAVGGGSTMDTCKVANLFTCYPEADLLEFVNAPIGKGSPIDRQLRPLIAIPTTAGTGSETTGTAIFDHGATGAKTGIANRALRPLLGIIDPLNTADCPTEVHVSSGLDVLFHSLESYTALPFNERIPRPAHPLLRPAYQGRNPVSDLFSFWALEQTVKYLPRVKANRYDEEARMQMCLAAGLAGIGFGNAGVHLCHGASYPISGLNKSHGKYKHPGYVVDHPIVPHGISVALTGPAVFEFLAPSSPDRHRQIAQVFHEYGSQHDPDLDRISDPAVLGQILYDRIAAFLATLDVPRGLSHIGYTASDIPDIVKGTLPQRRVLDLAPGVAEMAVQQSTEALSGILERSMAY